MRRSADERHAPAQPLDSGAAPVAFLFDLDGVLVDTRLLVRQLWDAYAAARGRTIDDDEFLGRIQGRRTAEILIDVFGVDPADARAQAAAGLDDRTAELAAGAELPEIAGAVAFVRATVGSAIPVALASSASLPNVTMALQRLGLTGLFAAVVTSQDVAHGKPAPDAYLEAARRIDVEPRRCVVFEDSSAGLDAARAAGARTVGVATSETPDDLAELAEIVIPDFVGLDPRSILDRLSGPAWSVARA